MDKIQEYYDVIARAVRLILDHETDVYDICAVPRAIAEYQERKILELIDNKDGWLDHMEECLEKSFRHVQGQPLRRAALE